jgi:2',3'-cyclic-nucleotide 2'-phosphodiesterase (5'-nucleotidase family)
MISKSKKMFSVAIILSMLLTVFVPVTKAMATSEDITILYTNDVHTYIDNNDNTGGDNYWRYSKIAAFKQTFDNNKVLLLDAGDHLQGTAYGSTDNGEKVTELMAAAGYDAATMGNHEFDYGMERALQVALNSKFPYLSCNFRHLKDGVRGDTVLDAYQIFERNGKKIAVVGVATPETFTRTTPGYFQDENGEYIYDISGGSDGQDLYNDVQKAIDEAKAEGADYIIGLGHLGVEPGAAPWRSEDVIANTTGFNAFIDGHSHSYVEGRNVTDKAGNTVVLSQTGAYMNKIGMMTIADDGTITTKLVGGSVQKTKDTTTKEIEDKWIKEINGTLGQVVGVATVVFDNFDENGNRLVRKEETNTGDFAADALKYLFESRGDEIDAAIMNGGGVRSTAITGELTYLSLKKIHTFDNTACLIRVSGQQLLDAIEWGVRDCPNEDGAFPQVSGIKYEINPYVKSTVKRDDKGVWVSGPTGEYRVRNLQIFNKKTGEYEPIDLNKQYNIAGYDYDLCDLGDGCAMYAGATILAKDVAKDFEVLANYIKSFPVDETTGYPTITAENSPYGNLRGDNRILITCSHDISTTPVGNEKEATCTTDGYTGDHICDLCAAEIPGQTIAAKGHDFTNGTCLVCGESEVATPTASETNRRSANAKTGDTANMSAWAMLLMMAAAGAYGTYHIRKRAD